MCLLTGLKWLQRMLGSSPTLPPYEEIERLAKILERAHTSIAAADGAGLLR